MIRRFMGAVALAAAVAGGAQAAPVSADFVYNYSGVTGYSNADFVGYLRNAGVSYQLYGGLNLTGALLGTVTETVTPSYSFNSASLGSSYADFADGTFSILWHADDIDLVPSVKDQGDVTLNLNFSSSLYRAGLSVGQNCIANPGLSVCATSLPPGPNASDVPEPTSLALVGIAAVAGIGAGRRRRKD